MGFIKNWSSFILEFVDYNKIKDISLEISSLISFQNMYILRNIHMPQIFKVSGNRLSEIDNKLFKQDEMIKNYLHYFKNIEIKNSEIIKIEYEKYNWITIFLCYSKNEKYSVLSYSPDLNESNVIEIVNDYLESKNFKVLKKELLVNKITSKFLNSLVKIFRDVSGRNYTSSLFPKIKKHFEDFKNNNKIEWGLFEKWKLKNLGSSVKCVRYIDLPDYFELHLIDGSVKKLEDLKIKDLFYYPITKREFSQWAEVDDNLKSIKKDLGGIVSSGEFGFVSNIPTKQIIFTNRLMMYNFSPHVSEREVIVEHDINKAYDKNIICKIV